MGSVFPWNCTLTHVLTSSPVAGPTTSPLPPYTRRSPSRERLPRPRVEHLVADVVAARERRGRRAAEPVEVALDAALVPRELHPDARVDLLAGGRADDLALAAVHQAVAVLPSSCLPREKTVPR